MSVLDLMPSQEETIGDLREEIERLRRKLNSFVTESGEFTSKDQMLQVSIQLDRLIFKYMLACQPARKPHLNAARLLISPERV